MTAPLVLALPFIEGETLSGYVSRSAKHFETTPRDLCSDLGMSWPRLCSGYSEQLERLSWLIDVPSDQLIYWSAKKTGIGRYRVGGTFSSTGVFRKTTTRLCPECVVDGLKHSGVCGVFQLLEWSVLSINRCSVHGCGLITLQSAKHSHETYDFASQVFSQKQFIVDARDKQKFLPPTDFEEYVRKRIWHGPPSDWLESLELTHLDRACLTLGAMRLGLPQANVMSLPLDIDREAHQVGFACLSKGPQALHKLLDDFKGGSKNERPYFSTDMGVFYTWLKSLSDEPGLQPILDCVHDFVCQTYPVKMGQEVLNKRVQKVTWLTFEEAASSSGFGVAFFKRLIGYVESLTADEVGKLSEVSEQLLERVKARWSELCSITEAAELLAVSRPQVRQLKQRGILRSVQFGSTRCYFEREALQSILSKLDNIDGDYHSTRYFPLRKFCQLRGVHISSVIQAWWNGELENKVRKGIGAGFQQLEIDIVALGGAPIAGPTRDLDLSETARFLRISLISIRKLRDAGYLVQVRKRNPETNNLRSYISKSSISEFMENYITVGQLAHEQRVAPMHLAQRLERVGQVPIQVHIGQPKVYDRTALMRANLL